MNFLIFREAKKKTWCFRAFNGETFDKKKVDNKSLGLSFGKAIYVLYLNLLSLSRGFSI